MPRPTAQQAIDALVPLFSSPELSSVLQGAELLNSTGNKTLRRRLASGLRVRSSGVLDTQDWRFSRLTAGTPRHRETVALILLRASGRLEKATTLDLSDGTLLDCSALRGLPRLAWLALPDPGQMSLAPLATLPSLEHLSIGRAFEPGLDHEDEPWSFACLPDLAFLADHPRLHTVSVPANETLADVSGLSGLCRIKNLSLGASTVLADITPLRGLAALEELDLSITAVTDLSPLAGLTRLQSLSLDTNTGLSDLSPLSGLRALAELNLSETKVRDLGPLRGCAALSRLLLGGTRVQDLSPLKGLTGLTWLSLGGYSAGTMRGVDVLPLASLPALSFLDLSGCRDLPVPPKKPEMTTRRQVAQYQARLRAAQQ